MSRILEGLYSGRWEVSFKPYLGADFSRLCLIFPGQGAAVGSEISHLAYQELELVRQRFDEADARAAREGLPLPSAYVMHGDGGRDPDLAMVDHLALCTLQVGLGEHLIARGVAPRMVTGFSQGEYPALVCAGALDFSLMIDLLLARDRACSPANELGFLIAVGASPDRIAEILPPRSYHLCNLNSPQQTVIAVIPEQVRQIEAAITAQGLRCKVLEGVSQPYHSPLVLPAAERFRNWLEPRSIRLRAPRIPVFSSVTKSFIPTDGLDAAAATELLARQIVEPVNFIQQIETAYEARCYSFLEVGPGTALSTFARDILMEREHKILDLTDQLAFTARIAQRRSGVELVRHPLFSIVQRVIARVTGYEIESISIEDRFQEDLGIDSIKKAEILISVLNETDQTPARQLDASTIRSLEDAVYVLSDVDAGRTEEEMEPREVCFLRHVLTWKRCELAAVPEASKPMPSRVFRLTDLLCGVVAGDELEEGQGAIVLVAGTEDFADDLARDIEKLIRFMLCFRSLARSAASGDRDLWLVTVAESHPFSLGLGGFLKAFRKEMPRWSFRHLQLASMPEEAELLRLVALERAAGNELEVRYRQGVREVATLEPSAALVEEEATASPGRTVVVAFGGAKGITHALLERLTYPREPHLYLAGRSPREEVTEALGALSRITRHIEYTSLDACDRAAVAEHLAAVHRQHGRIDLVLNGVGIERSAPLASKTVEDITEELKAKVLPAAHLLSLASELTIGLVVNFSSIAAHWGNPGQTVYSCANDILNRLTVAYNRRLGRKGAVAIEWPPWDGVGMTAHQGVLQRLRRLGLGLLGPEEAARLLASDLCRPRHDVVQYIDPLDLPLLSLTLEDHRPRRALIGDPNPLYQFERVLDRQQDPWLADHAIDNVSYLPAAAALAMALGLGRLVRKNVNTIERFRIQQPVIVRQQPVPLRLEPIALPAGLGIRGHSHTPHFTCRTTCSTDLEVPRPRRPRGGQKISSENLYTPDLFFHGPTFQVLHDVRLAADGSLSARIETSRLMPVYGLAFWDRLTQWLDGAFQSLALAALLRSPMMALPVEVERLSLVHDPSVICPSVVVLPTIDKIDQHEVRGHVLVLEERSGMALHLQGVRLQVFRSLAHAPSLPGWPRPANGFSSRDAKLRPPNRV